jgi:hypothetical protein
MSRSHPLSYPAPQPSKKHFHPLKFILPNDYSKSLLDQILANPFMRGPFRKISGHGTIPILLGAAVVAEGQFHLLVRGIAIALCALWLSLDGGVWICETKWKPGYKAIGFGATAGVLSSLAMVVMYWFLLSALVDQQADVAARLELSISEPAANRDLSNTIVTATNNSGTALVHNSIFCIINRITFDDPEGSYPPPYTAMGLGTIRIPSDWPKPSKEIIQAYGDAQSERCLGMLKLKGVSVGYPKDLEYPKGLPVCADITAVISYHLSTQPLLLKEKRKRVVARAAKGADFVWRPQLVNESCR